jgi:hypothetical protein
MPKSLGGLKLPLMRPSAVELLLVVGRLDYGIWHDVNRRVANWWDGMPFRPGDHSRVADSATRRSPKSAMGVVC